MTDTLLRVDLWSDLVCPWCYIGKRRLDRALEASGMDGEAEVVLRAFELDPGTPRTAAPVVEVLTRKFHASAEQVAAMESRIAGLAAAEGLPFVADRPYANTFDAHRISQLAADHGAGTTVFDALQRGLFAGTADPFDPATLRREAAAVGVPADQVDAVLQGDAYADAVRTDEALARDLGITGVPFTVFDMSVAVSGAQATDVFVRAIETALAQRSEPGREG